MKITFVGTEYWEEEFLKSCLSGHELQFYPKGKNFERPDTDILCNFVDVPVTKQVLEKLPNLKYITTRSTGFDHIDLQACAERGVTVSNVPAYGENTVAEYTFALLLALSRKIVPGVKRLRENADFSTNGLQGFDLKGKTIGVIGTGHIGAYVIRIALGFSMQVVAYDPYPNEKLRSEYGFEYMSLEDLLKVSDVITLHVPYMPATHHLLNSRNLMTCKPGAVLINTARGGLVETEGLIAALKEKVLSGAALDVLEEEGFIPDEQTLLSSGHPSMDQLKNLLVDHELMHMDNVLVTPHNAFNSREALLRILGTTADNIENFVQGKIVNEVKIKNEVKIN